MRNVFTIFKRELKSYFISPIGYIFLIVFWLVSISLYVWPFFTYPFPTAEMIRYFALLPIVLSVFIPAVTMRLWAEERKLNTFEMLQTFPMTSTHVVLGKYAASLVFYLIALAGTATVPVMLAHFGDPDWGVIFSSYLGAFLLGALYLALGLFFSGFCKDQIVAYVVSLMGLLGIYLLGTEVLRDIFPFATQLRDILGVSEHYHEFTKGVIDTVHIVYFLVWIALFLFLNGFYIESRSRRGTVWLFAAALVLCLGIGFAFNYVISSRTFGRLDMTENKVYTLSPGTVNILKKLKAPVTITLYISAREDMPAELADLERNIVSKIEEMRVKSGNKIIIRRVHPRSEKYLEERQKELERRLAELRGEKKEKEEEKAEKEKAIEEKLFKKGVTPFNVGVARGIGQRMSKWIYSSIGIDYKEHETEFIHQVVPAMLDRLEYEIIRRIHRMIRTEKPVIAMVAPKTSIPDYLLKLYVQMGRPLPPQRDPYSRVQELLSKDYEVERVQLTADSPLPEEYDVLLIISPPPLSKRQLWEINKAVVEGKPTIIAANQHQFKYVIKKRRPCIDEIDISSKINDVLEKYGVSISRDVLMSTNFVPLREVITSDANPDVEMLAPVDSPLNILLTAKSMNKNHPITNRLEKLFYRWGSPIRIDKEKVRENKLKVVELISTGETAWAEPPDQFNTDPRLAAKLHPPLVRQSYPCVVLAEGRFPNAFKGERRPEWPKGGPGMPPPKEKGPDTPLESKPGKLVLIGSGDIFHNQLVDAVEDTAKLLVNVIDYCTGARDLISVRNKGFISRLIEQSKLEESNETLWKIFVIGGFSIFFAVGGMGYYFARTQGRRRFRASAAGGAERKGREEEEGTSGSRREEEKGVSVTGK